jgi:group I intron endonuclease
MIKIVMGSGGEKMIGIYEIKNLKTNKSYIGQSIDIEARWKQHKNMLNNKIHHSTKLQNSWSKHKEEAFDFSVLEICTREELNEKENYFILIKDAITNGYNMGGNRIFSLNKTPKTKLERFIVNNEAEIKYFYLSSKKIYNDVINLKCNNYILNKLNLSNGGKYKTLKRPLKCINMLPNIIKTINEKGSDNTGIYISYVNYLSDIGSFEYKTLDKINNKWYSEGKRNYSHKNWKTSYKYIIYEFLLQIYYNENVRYLLKFFYNAEEFLDDRLLNHTAGNFIRSKVGEDIIKEFIDKIEEEEVNEQRNESIDIQR